MAKEYAFKTIPGKIPWEQEQSGSTYKAFKDGALAMLKLMEEDEKNT